MIYLNPKHICRQLFHLFAHIRIETSARYPKEEHIAAHISVAGFIFLRFFVPAILNPKLFGVFDEFSDVKTSRKFTLIAKSIQNLANLVEFGQKEPFMNEMNVWIKANYEKCRTYIRQISTLPVGKNSSVKPEVEPLTDEKLAIQCARLFEILSESGDKLNESATVFFI
jgi:hypothetical protein